MHLPHCITGTAQLPERGSYRNAAVTGTRQLPEQRKLSGDLLPQGYPFPSLSFLLRA